MPRRVSLSLSLPELIWVHIISVVSLFSTCNDIPRLYCDCILSILQKVDIFSIGRHSRLRLSCMFIDQCIHVLVILSAFLVIWFDRLPRVDVVMRYRMHGSNKWKYSRHRTTRSQQGYAMYSMTVYRSLTPTRGWVSTTSHRETGQFQISTSPDTHTHTS